MSANGKKKTVLCTFIALHTRTGREMVQYIHTDVAEGVLSVDRSSVVGISVDGDLISIISR